MSTPMITTAEYDEEVKQFLDSIENEKKRGDCYALLDLMTAVTGETGRMQHGTAVGFGLSKLPETSGDQEQHSLIGFSPKEDHIAIHLFSDFSLFTPLLEKLGTNSIKSSTIRIKTLDEIDIAVLRELISESVTYLLQKNANFE
ncbi:MAG: DUF1801 domain-containing protein [Spirochaetia bacterium]|nr:DUF1801 domain-containing protein [Spirochaetia bacterium]